MRERNSIHEKKRVAQRRNKQVIKYSRFSVVQSALWFVYLDREQQQRNFMQ